VKVVAARLGQEKPSLAIQTSGVGNHFFNTSSYQIHSRCAQLLAAGAVESSIDPTCSIRIAIQYTTTDVPTPPAERATKVADDFATKSLKRPFNPSRDHIHLPTDFDSDERRQVWILCDFRV
jgi:hypothetical protein